MKITARIILACLFLYFIIGGILADDGLWRLCSALTLLAIFMYGILFLLIIAFRTDNI